MAENNYSYKEFKRTINGCSQNRIKQQILLDYLKTDEALFDRYFEKLRFELSVEEQKQKLEALQKLEENEND